MKHTDMSLNLRILDTTDDSVNEVIGRYSDSKALEVLKRYLEPGGDLSMEQAVKLIDDMLPNTEERDPHYVVCNVLATTAAIVQLSEIGWTDEGHKIYASMHSFRTAVRECYDPEFEPGGDEEVYFVNISAFIARLAALNILDDTLWAMPTMKDTLENESSAR
ncbi:hypothetical protein TCE0_018r06115 [Talaromyces pinophilus]|uniref:Uncharacterized protein n=1 Tax=Talaromyces pinophilus TaxID=128442 RepID=A0A510NX07_TALPI|nr:hypothetical protein TCE0_018r06115 [Talaromyces pinophilus]